MHIQDVLPQDAIPSIDDPVMGPNYFGDGDDEVIVVDTTPPRAYPLRILSYHEIVNDVLEGDDRANPETDVSSHSAADSGPIAVTWCPICASAVVYDRRVDGRVLTFGTSGKLADDALVMYDRETESEWNQPLGRAINGALEGTQLAVVPMTLMSWHRFQAAYPDGVVLQPVQGRDGPSRGDSPRAVYERAPYERYEAADGFGLYEMRGDGRKRTWDREDISAKTVVLGIVDERDAIGYPMPQVHAAGGIITDTVGSRDVVVLSTDDEIRAFENPGYEFERRGASLYADGTSWDTRTGRSDDGRSLSRVPARRLYAFAWQDVHGPASFYGLS